MPSTVDLINLRSVMGRMAKVFKSARELLQAKIEDLESVESWTDEETLMYAKDVLGVAEDEGTIEEAQDEWDLGR